MPIDTHGRRVAESLMDPQMYATSLLALVVDQYGTEAYSWEPETLDMELKEDFGVDLPPVNSDKLHGVISCLTTDQFYRDWMAFNHICQVLSNDPIDLNTLDVCDAEDMAWGITEMLALDGADRPEFSPEVRRFIGFNLARMGLFHPPDVLKIADYPPGHMERATDNLGDDPGLYAAWQGRSRADADLIVGVVRERLKELVTQLDLLPLRNRDAGAWGKLMAAAEKGL